MREIVQLQLGQCGNRVGTRFLQQIATEHGLDANGRLASEPDYPDAGLSAYFSPSLDGTYIPRAIAFDISSDSRSLVEDSSYGSLIRPDNMVFGSGSQGSSRNFVTALYDLQEMERVSPGFSELRDTLMDSLRREVERCDHCAGVQVVRSLAGGTGALFEHAFQLGQHDAFQLGRTEEFPLLGKLLFNVAPFRPDGPENQRATDLEYFSTCMALGKSLLDNGDRSLFGFNFDNFAVGELWKRSYQRALLQKKNPTQARRITFDNLNSIIAEMMANITASYRFPLRSRCFGGDFVEFHRNMVPIRHNWQFLSVGYASCVPKNTAPADTAMIRNLLNAAFADKSRSILTNKTSMADSICASSYVMLRGSEMNYADAQQAVSLFSDQYRAQCFEPSTYDPFWSLLPSPRGVPNRICSATVFCASTVHASYWHSIWQKGKSIWNARGRGSIMEKACQLGMEVECELDACLDSVRSMVKIYRDFILKTRDFDVWPRSKEVLEMIEEEKQKKKERREGRSSFGDYYDDYEDLCEASDDDEEEGEVEWCNRYADKQEEECYFRSIPWYPQSLPRSYSESPQIGWRWVNPDEPERPEETVSSSKNQESGDEWENSDSEDDDEVDDDVFDAFDESGEEGF